MGKREMERVRDEEGERDDRPADEARVEAAGNGREARLRSLTAVVCGGVGCKKLEWTSKETRGQRRAGRTAVLIC